MSISNISAIDNKLSFKLIDLSHELDSKIPSWDNGCGFNHSVTTDYSDCQTDVKFRIDKLEMYAGIGTHIDAPAHCVQDGLTMEKLSINDLIAPLIIIDVSAKANENYHISVDDVKEFEEEYGQIPPGCFVILFTGWCKYWHDRDKYNNNHCFPSVSLDAANFLLGRNIKGLGIDTLSPDRPESGYCVHKAVLSSGKYIIENIADCKDVPIVGSSIIALPLKIKNGTESPLRLVSLSYTR